jgi:organic hydroperoxide reductase OsmC/OhrA
VKRRVACVVNYSFPMKRTRAKRRGTIAVEELLSIAAVMGCFMVPVSIAARSAGTRVANDMDRTHETLMQEPKQ